MKAHPTQFLVLALPRSRSKWLSVFLQYGSFQVGHDEIRHMRSLDDVQSWLSQENTGSCETALSPFWRLIPAGMRIVTVHRPVDEVLASLRRGGMQFSDAEMRLVLEHAEAKLMQINKRLPDVLSVRFADLEDEACCAEVFEHCLPYRHDPEWWGVWAPINIQQPLAFQLRYWSAYQPQLQKLAKQAKHRILRDMRSSGEMDGITFQTEPWRQFYADGKHLFAEHCAQTHPSPDDYVRKNIPLFERLDDAGALHVWTGRSNGRMFSYLVSVLAPSLDNPGETLAEQTIFFADPSWPGLGMKTQRAAVEDLRQRGINRVLMRAGHRGSGPRLGAMFRRMGAEPFGQVWNMEL